MYPSGGFLDPTQMQQQWAAQYPGLNYGTGTGQPPLPTGLQTALPSTTAQPASAYPTTSSPQPVATAPGPGTPTTPGAPGATTASAGDPMDRNYIIDQLTKQLQQMGLQPGPRGSGVTDVQYYADQILATGGWQGGNAGYWTNRLQQDAGGGGGTGGGMGGGGFGFGDLNFQYSPYKQPAPFTPPTLDQLRNMPGYQFALDQGLQGIQHGAAANGTLLTGGTLKALQGYGTGLADQFANQLFNQALQTNQTNFSQGLLGNQNIFNQGLQGNQTNYGNLYNLARLGLAGATA